MNINATLRDLIDSIKPADPYKIILFGSHAAGNATEQSDIDIMVILDNNDVSKTYNERQQKKLYIRKLAREINYRTALDILVYSKEELQKLKEYGNYFIEEIEKTGTVIYEKTN